MAKLVSHPRQTGEVIESFVVYSKLCASVFPGYE